MTYSRTTPLNPGIILTPAFFATTFDSILSPMAIIASFGGPINVIPFSFNLVANSAFSERKPYPGWTAWAPVFSKKVGCNLGAVIRVTMRIF